MRNSRRIFPVALFGILLVLGASTAESITCNVPSSSYPTIQSAVDVLNCTEIVLANGLFVGDVTIGRTLTLQGASSDSTVVVGKVTVQGSGTQATLMGLKIAVLAENLPHGGLVVIGDAEVIPGDLVIGTSEFGLADFIFFDGFESGDTTLWSKTVP